MGMEDLDFAANGTVSKVTDYGIGPRGIDAMYVAQNGTTSASYPLYDAHGNMISTLNKQGIGGFAYSALRTFDAWGVIRRGAQTGDPKGRYCASLGHKQDDESGLVYMRARYYEAISGRFISEDPGFNGSNWYVYAAACPTGQADFSGCSAKEIEDIVKRMFGKRQLSRAQYEAFMNKSNDVRARIHSLITGEHMPDERIEEIIDFETEEFCSGIELEPDLDVASDLASGLEADDLVLMEETLIVEQTPVDFG